MTSVVLGFCGGGKKKGDKPKKPAGGANDLRVQTKAKADEAKDDGTKPRLSDLKIPIPTVGRGKTAPMNLTVARPKVRSNSTGMALAAPNKFAPPQRAGSWSSGINRCKLPFPKYQLADPRLSDLANRATDLVYDLEKIQAWMKDQKNVVPRPSDASTISALSPGTAGPTSSTASAGSESNLILPNMSSTALLGPRGSGLWTDQRRSVFRESVLLPLPEEKQDESATKFIEEFFPLIDAKKTPKCLSKIFTLEYDVYELGKELPKQFCDLPLTCTVIIVLERLGCVKKLKDLEWITIVKYMLKLEAKYNDVPYHSKWHAADVVATLAYFLKMGWFRDHLTPEEQVVAVIAAGAHDVAHDGRNNAYHMAAKTEIGLAYPQSVLEYHHVATATGIRNIEGCDWTKGLNYEAAWTLFTALILRTDPALHPPDGRKPFTNLANMSKEEREKAGEELLPLLELLHLADISNPCKPVNVAKRWSENYYKEYTAVGKLNKEKNLKMKMYKEGKIAALEDTQIGFITFIALHSFKDLIVFLPEAKELVTNLEANLAFWKKVKEDGGEAKNEE